MGGNEYADLMGLRAPVGSLIGTVMIDKGDTVKTINECLLVDNARIDGTYMRLSGMP